MSLKRIMCVASFTGAVAVSFYGAGCSSSSPNTTTQDSGGITHPMMDTGTTNNDTGTSPGDALPPIDTGTPSGDAGTCAPGSATGFTASAKPSPGNLCSASLLSSIMPACFGSTATTAMCTAAIMATTAATDCYEKCIFSPYTNAAWGALVIDEFGTMADPGGQVTLINIAGCLEVANAADTACATAQEENLACEMSVCDPVAACALPAMATTAEEDNLFNCYGEASATGGPCASYGTAYTTACNVGDSGQISLDSGAQAAQCFAIEAVLSSTTATAAQQTEAIAQYATIICGGGFAALDGGS